MMIWEFSCFIVILAIYFIPSILAYKRHHANRRAILGLNAFGGLLGVGWIVAFSWSQTDNVLAGPLVLTEEEKTYRALTVLVAILLVGFFYFATIGYNKAMVQSEAEIQRIQRQIDMLGKQ